MGCGCMGCINKVLFALLVLLQLLVSTIDAAVLSQSHVDKELKDPTENQMKTVRYYRLFSSCSNKLVQLKGLGRESQIDALGSKDSVHADLVVETHTFGSQLRIISRMTGGHLCFNRRGKLTIRTNGESDRCVFTEVITPDGQYTQFQSVANKKWFLGFNKRGKVMKGYKARVKTKCTKFTKDTDYTKPQRQEDDKNNKWVPNLDRHIAELTKTHKIRHQRTKDQNVHSRRSRHILSWPWGVAENT